MYVLVEWLSGWTGMVSIILNEVFSWNICGLNVGAMAIIVFVLTVIVLLLRG